MEWLKMLGGGVPREKEDLEAKWRQGAEEGV